MYYVTRIRSIRIAVADCNYIIIDNIKGGLKILCGQGLV